MGGARRVGLTGIAGLLAVAAQFASFAAPAPAGAQAAVRFTLVAPQQALPAGDRVVAVAELTGDGVPDLIVQNAEGDSVGVMAGSAGGTFGAPSSVALGGRPVGAQVADFNDDGRPDLLVPIETKATPRPLNLLAEHVQMLFGNGTGGFAAGPVLALPERGPVYVGDFNGDGNSDVVVGPDGCWGESNTTTYYTLLGDGHGNLGAARKTIAATRGCLGEVGDFNRDGRADVAIYSPGAPGSSDEVVVLPGEAPGRFGSAILTPAPAAGFYIAGVGDFDGNGSLDLLVARLTEPSTFTVLLGNGLGGFTTAGTYASGAQFGFRAALGDFNGDGRVDIAAIGNQIDLLENTGGGAFTSSLVTPLAQSYGQAFTADVNRDGRPDLVLAGPASVGVFLDEAVPPPGAPPSAHTHARKRTSLLARFGLSRRAHRAVKSLRVSGAVRLEGGTVPPEALCKGRVRIRIALRQRTLTRTTAVLTKGCAFHRTLQLEARALAGKRKATVIVTFAGNSSLVPASLRRQLR